LNFAFSPFALLCQSDRALLTSRFRCFHSRRQPVRWSDRCRRTPTSRHFAFTESVALGRCFHLPNARCSHGLL
jgi:hypothetical protein